MLSLLKNLFFTGLALVVVAVLVLLFRVPVMRAIGNVLIDEDARDTVAALFVLSGDPWDRGNEAVALYKSGLAQKVICTGENIPRLFLITNIQYPESELTHRHLISEGVARADAILLSRGTSTREEADHILEYCRSNNITRAGVLSGRFHTKRIRMAFAEKFEEAGIGLVIFGAPSSVYDEQHWWRSEEGLIFVNNEYLKIAYYWWLDVVD